jgi:hypothetical protein
MSDRRVLLAAAAAMALLVGLAVLATRRGPRRERMLGAPRAADVPLVRSFEDDSSEGSFEGPFEGPFEDQSSPPGSPRSPPWSPPASPPGSPPGSPRRPRVRAVPNPGGGDCLFHAFSQAAALAGREVSVAALREAVAAAATDDMLAELKSVRAGENAELARDFEFARGVETLEQLRAAMRTSRYWGDELALPALERATDLRAVVLLHDGGPPRVAARLDGAAPRAGVIFLKLRRAHYELLEVDGRYIFDASRAPRLCQQTDKLQ